MVYQNKADSLLAGAARVEISPRAGTQLAGDVGIFRPAHSILDPLFARALVLQQGEHKLCILGLDVTFIAEEHTAQIRKAAQDQLGFDPDAVMVHATQTHSAPPIGHFLLDEEFSLAPEFEWLRLGDSDYSAFATARAIEALRLAEESLRPVQIGVGSAVRDGLAFNRRGVMRDGKVGMPWTYTSVDAPLGPTQYRYLEGPTDPEIGVMCLRDESLQMVALLLHFTCHPVNDFYYRGKGSKPRVSADWPGAWSEALRAVHGDACVPVVLNGCCGNINPWPPFEPDFVPDHRRMGRTLAEISDKILSSLDFHEEAALDWRVKRIPLPLRDLDAKDLAEAESYLSEHPAPVRCEDDPNRVEWEWYRAAMLVSLDLLRQRDPTPLYEIQALRIGDTAIVGLPGEPFVEGQLQIKIESPTYPTYVAHATSHFAGYLPTRGAFQRGGHEVVTSSWSRWAPEALQTIVGESVSLLQKMFDGSSAGCRSPRLMAAEQFTRGAQ